MTMIDGVYQLVVRSGRLSVGSIIIQVVSINGLSSVAIGGML